MPSARSHLSLSSFSLSIPRAAPTSLVPLLELPRTPPMALPLPRARHCCATLPCSSAAPLHPCCTPRPCLLDLPGAPVDAGARLPPPRGPVLQPRQAPPPAYYLTSPTRAGPDPAIFDALGRWPWTPLFHRRTAASPRASVRRRCHHKPGDRFLPLTTTIASLLLRRSQVPLEATREPALTSPAPPPSAPGSSSVRDSCCCCSPCHCHGLSLVAPRQACYMMLPLLSLPRPLNPGTQDRLGGFLSTSIMTTVETAKFHCR